MHVADYLPALRDEVGRMSRAAHAGMLTAPVAACPEWSLADLVWHVGGVHHFWTEIVARELDSPDQVVRASRPDERELLPWFDETAGRLIDVLGASRPDATVWTWSSQQDVAFVHRRMAQETAVHRWDAEKTAGEAAPIDRELATDGIDEFVEFMVPDGPPITDRFMIATTDSGGSWALGPGEDAVATITATASDLLLALWRRLPLEVVTITGDRPAAERFVNRTDLE